jgi:hypothetical protein
MRQSSIDKLRRERDEAVTLAELLTKALIDKAPAATVKDAIVAAFPEPNPDRSLGGTALRQAQVTKSNRRTAEAIIFDNDERNDVAKSIEKGRSRARKRNAEPRRGSDEWRKQVLAAADERAKAALAAETRRRKG